MGTGRRPAPGRGHRGSGYPAGQGNLVPGHQPAPARRPTRARQPLAGCQPGRDRAPVRHPALDRASYKQVKDELGWADFHVRSDVAIRRHQALVNCADVGFFAADHPPAATILHKAGAIAELMGLDPKRAQRWAAAWTVLQECQAWRDDQSDLDAALSTAEFDHLIRA